MKAVDLITEHLDIWTTAQALKTSGRGKRTNQGIYGIKKLRELILELAVCGKLIPQNPNDEPANALLARIAEEKSRMLKAGKIKKQKTLLEIQNDDHLPSLPTNWSWTSLGTISQINPRNMADDNQVVSFIPMPYISTSHTGEHGQDQRIWSEVKKGYTHFADGDVGLAKITPCFENSKAVVFSKLQNSIGAGTTELHVARPFSNTLNVRYILLYLKSPQFLYVGQTKMTGTAGQKRVPKEFFAGNPLPLPPLDEQHRIVAKVDELMALCDQLEQQQTNSNATHQTLVKTLLATLTDPTNEAGKTDPNALDIFFQHFDTLFTTEESIDQLKQTILQLAVMGRLVPQDPSDKPASILLEELSVERDHWLNKNAHENKECATMLRKLNKLGLPISPFEIPDSWAATHLIQTSRFLVDCHNKTAPYTKSGTPIIRTSNIRHREFKLEGVKFVDSSTFEYWSRRCPPESGDIIFTREAPMGEAAIIPEGAKYCLGQRTMLVRSMHDYISSKYLLLTLTEPNLLKRVSIHAIGSTVKHLRVGDVENLAIPIPPYAEQHRIVAKVTELINLCDALKDQLNTRRSTQLQLALTFVDQVAT